MFVDIDIINTVARGMLCVIGYAGVVRIVIEQFCNLRTTYPSLTVLTEFPVEYKVIG